LFDEAEAQAALSLFESRAVDVPFAAGAFSVTFRGAGHILGAAFAELHCALDRRTEASLVFSGDLGRYDAPLHADPEPLPECDTLVLESTYGDRNHPDETLAEQLRRPLEETIRRRGTILIPAFAVARAQLVMLLLRQLMESGEIPALPIHVDSPMAIDVTGVYRRHFGSSELDVARHDLFPKGVWFHRSIEQSKSLNHMPGPRIIIAASGMMTGGRVLHHLRRLLPDPRNLVVLVGYQAAGTRGRSLLEGARTLRMHGLDVPARAHFLNVEGLSAHADARDLVRWVNSGAKLPKTVFLTHGEPSALEALSGRLRSQGINTIVPLLSEQFQLVGTGAWQPSALSPVGVSLRPRKGR
jgi:metallo-beta-lactamase family protein